MAKCDICGKGVHFGNNVSHSHRRSNRVWKSNVQNVTCKVNGQSKRMEPFLASKVKVLRLINTTFFDLFKRKRAAA